MTKIIIFFFLFISAAILPQQKHFIYFKDKGPENQNSLNKSSQLYTEALERLSHRSVQRRMKNMGEEIILYEDLPVYAEYINDLNKLGIKIIHELNWFNSVSAALDDGQFKIVSSLPFVKSVERVNKLYYKNPEVPEQELYKIANLDSTFDYGLSFKQVNLSDVPFVHSKGIDGKNVLIGILDSGFDWKKHESLTGRNVIAEFDFIFNDSVTANEDGDIPDQHSHGTSIFSILGGYKSGFLIGPAYNSSFILAKTEDVRSETHIEEDNYAAALIWMESLGVDITSSSLGYNIFDKSTSSYTYNDMDGKTTIVTKAAELAFERGITAITSAGNEGNTSWKFIVSPADGFNTIAVGAVNELGSRANFSSIGPTFDGRIKPEIAALGVQDFHALAGTIDQYGFSSGTSTAAPIASGIAALLLSAHTHLKNTQIRSILLGSASNSSNPNNEIGYGIISAKRAIEFPNLELVNNNFKLHKIFFDNGLNQAAAKIFYKTGSGDFLSANLINEDGYNYSYNFPSIANGQKVEFYFTFSDSQSNEFRIPEIKNYEFIYGSDVISLNLETKQTFAVNGVSDFFPNPFLPSNNKTTRVIFNSSGNELFKMIIIDGTGQKIKEISMLSNPGENFVEWDGYSDHGYLCASGVYYALIHLAGKEFGKKLILLK